MTPTMKTLHRQDLQPGDILLSAFEHPDAAAYLQALLKAIQYRNYKNEEERKKFLNAALIILRGLIITFDQDQYTHAAFWDGEHVVEAGMNGVGKNTITHYNNTLTDVYRFAKDGELKIGTAGYPVQPLLDESERLVAQQLSYSYNTVVLMIFLCVTRWEREAWIKSMEQFLKDHIAAINPAYIKLLFATYHDEIINLFEWLADEMIRQVVAFRKYEGMVCSEVVAAIFNEAASEPAGKYHLEKPLMITDYSDVKPSLLQISKTDEQYLKELTDVFEQEERMQRSGNASSLDWKNDIDILYTPHDIARSVSTKLSGRLEL